MTLWLLTVITLLGGAKHYEAFPDQNACANAMFEYAEIDGLDARCHRVVHEPPNNRV